jgi:hypothetical protein
MLSIDRGNKNSKFINDLFELGVPLSPTIDAEVNFQFGGTKIKNYQVYNQDQEDALAAVQLAQSGLNAMFYDPRNIGDAHQTNKETVIKIAKDKLERAMDQLQNPNKYPSNDSDLQEETIYQSASRLADDAMADILGFYTDLNNSMSIELRIQHHPRTTKFL